MKTLLALVLAGGCTSAATAYDPIPAEPALGPFEGAYMREVAFPLTRELSHQWHGNARPFIGTAARSTKPLEKRAHLPVIDFKSPVRFVAPPSFASATFLR